jgi:hypothetical protein
VLVQEAREVGSSAAEVGSLDEACDLFGGALRCLALGVRVRKLKLRRSVGIGLRGLPWSS